MICVRYQVNGQEFWDNNSGKNYFVNLIAKGPLPIDQRLNHRHSLRGHPNTRLSERYSFAASLLIADELARCVSESEEFGILLSLSSSPMNRTRSGLDFGSNGYEDMIKNLCYFKSEDASERLSDISQLNFVQAPDQRPQLSRAINCF
jgi:hypothetical protein